MKKAINAQAIESTRRFFQGLQMAIDNGLCQGLKNFCDEHDLNRVKYQRIKGDLNKPVNEWKYKVVDLDALQYLCDDFMFSAEWLLLGRGKMMKRNDN